VGIAPGLTYSAPEPFSYLDDELFAIVFPLIEAEPDCA
jgi:hypothetical protein